MTKIEFIAFGGPGGDGGDRRVIGTHQVTRHDSLEALVKKAQAHSRLRDGDFVVVERDGVEIAVVGPEGPVAS